jgi:NADPH:quinone reductase-like Zn-dependent oxidoreductase/acyl transferase domain-containing protein/SAM-dependent methyltransferase
MSHSMHQQGQVITKDVKGSNPCLEISSFHGPELLVLSAGDEDGIKRQAIALSNYVCSQHPKLDEQNVRNIVYTLNTRRTLLDWKAYTVLDSASCLSSLCDRLEKAVRGVAAASPRELGLVFTGQGAQWAGMGRELLDWQVFRNSIEHSQKSLETLGCDWTITGKQDRAQLVAHITDRDEIDELIKGPESSRMNETEISQTVSTVVQIGLVDLMKNLQLNISVVVGHSSGEIAAAYCAGLLCHASAVKVAYFRGLLAHKLSQTSNVSYGMLSVGVSWCQMREELLRIQAEQPANGKFDANKITISCINSPSNVTVSGPRELLEIVLEDFKTRDVFVRKLKVDLGYHSPQMNAIAEAYLNHLGELRSAHTQDVIRMVSSVTAEPVDKSAVCNASYWVQNMLCPVRFVDAMDLCSKRTAEEKDVHKLDLSHESRIVTDGWLEVGPHAALKGPLREIFTTTNRNDMFYASLLLRGKSALHTLLDAVGKLHCHDFKVDLTVMDRLQGARSKLPRTITTLPPYPFNHSITYWGNSSQAKTARKRQHPSNDLLGTQVMDWNPLDARWRLIIKKDSMPWIEHHMVHGKILYPGAGMLVMAIEAIKQVVTGQNIIGYEIRNASFTAPIILSDSSEGGEVRTNMAPTLIHASDTEYNFRVLVRRADDSWQEACAGTIVAESSKGTQDVTSKTEFEYNRFIAMAELHNASAACQTVVEPEKLYQKISENSGLQYGPMFQPLSNISYSSDGRGRADILPYLGSASETLQSFTIHPSTLDGIFQCIYLGLSKGWSEPFPTLVPSHLTRLWVSTVGVGHGMSGLDIASSSSNTLSKRTAVGSAHVFSQSDMNIRLEIEALELTEMPAPNDLQREASAPQPLCRKLDWKPDINMMTVEEMTDYCVEHRSSGTEPVEWFQNLRNMMLGFAAQALDRLDALQSHAIDAQAQYTYWLRSRVDEHLRSAEPDEKCKLLDSCVLEHGRQELFDDSKRGKLSAIVGERLFEILTGNLDPLEVIFADQALVNDYYREANQTGKAFDMLAAYLDALCHESPGQRYLEIGAGTGATTTWILRTIANPAAGVRYSEYHYTDISPYFLSHGTNVYADYSGMKYMTLNIEEDPMVQGYDQESYDVIIAANVLHATSDLGVTLGHVRKLLKPDGKLILMELTTPLNIDTAFVFGLLPGWWLSSEAYRSNGAVISEEQWDEVLRCNGFSGCDQTFRDWDDDQCHGWSIIITSISTPDLSSSSARPRSRSIAIVADSKSSMQRDVAERLKRDLECPKVEVEIMSLGDLYLSSDLNTKDVILLNGLDVCLLHDMHSYLFQAVQRLITSSKSVVWVNNMGSEQDDAPYWAMTDGLVRVCRNENIDIPLATLALQASNVDSTARQIGKVLSVIYNSITTDTMDLDWMEVDGRLCISRLSKAEHIDEYIFMRTERPVRRRKFGFGPPLKLDIKTPGLLDTIEWVDDTAAYLPLQPDDIEVRVQAIGMNSKECLTLLGRVNADQMGSEAAGIVHRLGSNVTDFRVGDRVVLGTANTYQTFVRVKHAVHLPDSISFVDAASIPTAFCTAYIGLVQVARLQKGETVLIHAAAGGTGQAAAQLARNIGAEVFVTVGSKMKKDLIIEQYQIPDDHIFYSRDASFADGVKRMTKGRGVDVILNSLSGKLLVASWESIAPFGRFVEIGRKSIDTRESLPMLPFIKNTMFAGVDIDAFLVGEAAKRGMEILREVFKMTEDGIIHPPYPVSRYTIDQAEDAFRLLQSGNNAGKMVLDVSEDVLVPVREAINGAYRFKSDATYVVSGAFGGIGRQISRWLARRGAQNIILLSRSTPEKNVEAHRLVNELESLGISIRNASCDVSDFESLQGALGHMSKDMPPIKGCFQAAMVLHVRTS